jgi:hypothetical protein
MPAAEDDHAGETVHREQIIAGWRPRRGRRPPTSVGATECREQSFYRWQARYGGLGLSRRLVEQDPTNAGWQREVAVAYNRAGGVLEAQGKGAKALAAYEEHLPISRRLVDQDPTNAGWQREVAVACVRIAKLERRRR